VAARDACGGANGADAAGREVAGHTFAPESLPFSLSFEPTKRKSAAIRSTAL
jgi:hypothetical protein